MAINPDPRAGRTSTQSQDAVGPLLRSVLSSSGDSTEALLWLPADAASAPIGGTPASGASPSSTGDALSAIFGKTDSGQPVALPLLIAALALAVLEVLLARRASHAEVDAAAAPVPTPQGSARAEAA